MNKEETEKKSTFFSKLYHELNIKPSFYHHCHLSKLHEFYKWIDVAEGDGDSMFTTNLLNIQMGHVWHPKNWDTAFYLN